MSHICKMILQSCKYDLIFCVERGMMGSIEISKYGQIHIVS